MTTLEVQILNSTSSSETADETLECDCPEWMFRSNYLEWIPVQSHFQIGGDVSEDWNSWLPSPIVHGVWLLVICDEVMFIVLTLLLQIAVG